MPPNPDPVNPIPPQVLAMAQMLAQLVGPEILRQFAANFPTGMADSRIPVVVRRETNDGPVMQQTCFAQLIAEHIDESKKLRKSLNTLSELTKEALDVTETRGRRSR